MAFTQSFDKEVTLSRQLALISFAFVALSIPFAAVKFASGAQVSYRESVFPGLQSIPASALMYSTTCSAVFSPPKTQNGIPTP